MAVCLEAHLVQSVTRHKVTRLVPGQGRAQGRATLCQGRWRTRSSTHVPVPGCTRIRSFCPSRPHRVRTRCAQGRAQGPTSSECRGPRRGTKKTPRNTKNKRKQDSICIRLRRKHKTVYMLWSKSRLSL